MARYALLAGINRYADDRISPLQFAERDAELFERALRDRGGFETIRLAGPDATREKILDTLSGAAGSPAWPALGAADQFLFFFAGHGELVGGQYMLHGYHARPGAGTHSVSLHDLAHLLRDRLPCRECACIIDACRNLALPGARGAGTAGLDAESKRDIQALRSAANEDKLITVLYGCDEGQVSLEDPALQQGVLSYHLTETLLDGGYPSIEELAEEAADRMRVWLRSHRPQSQQQPQVYRPVTARRMVLFDRFPELTALPPEVSAEVEKVRQLMAGQDFDGAQRLLDAAADRVPHSYQLRQLGREITEARRKAETERRDEQRRRLEEHVSNLLADAERFRAGGELDEARGCAEEAARLMPIGPAQALLERIKQTARTGPADRVSMLKRLFEQADKLEASDPESAGAMFQQALQEYPGNRRALDGCERCSLRLLGQRADAQAAQRLADTEAPLPRLREELKEYDDLAMAAEAEAARAEIARLERAVERAKGRHRFIESLAETTVKARNWGDFAEAMKASPSIQKFSWLIRSLKLTRELQAELTAAGGDSLPEFAPLIEELLTSSVLGTSVDVDAEAQQWHQLVAAEERQRLDAEERQRAAAEEERRRLAAEEQQRVVAEERQRVAEEYAALNRGYNRALRGGKLRRALKCLNAMLALRPGDREALKRKRDLKARIRAEEHPTEPTPVIVPAPAGTQPPPTREAVRAPNSKKAMIGGFFGGALGGGIMVGLPAGLIGRWSMPAYHYNFIAPLIGAMIAGAFCMPAAMYSENTDYLKQHGIRRDRFAYVCAFAALMTGPFGLIGVFVGSLLARFDGPQMFYGVVIGALGFALLGGVGVAVEESK